MVFNANGELEVRGELSYTTMYDLVPVLHNGSNKEVNDDIMMQGNDTDEIMSIGALDQSAISVPIAVAIKVLEKHQTVADVISLGKEIIDNAIGHTLEAETGNGANEIRGKHTELSMLKELVEHPMRLVAVDGWTGRNADIKDGVSVNIMAEPLSPDRVFDYPVDEPESHPAYDFFAPGPLPGYAGNPNNNNGWIKADVPLLGELGAEADEPMMIAPVIDAEEDITMLFRDDDFSDDDSEGDEEEEVWEMIAPVIDAEEDITMLFRDDDFSDDDFEGDEEEEVWEVNEEWLMALITQPPMPAVQPPSVYEVGGAGFASSCAAERYTDSTAAYHGFRDEQPGEHTDAVHFGDGYVTCSAGEKTTRTLVVL
nr:protein phosphatase 2C 16-like [Tanacetum cinerariifolium]